MRVLTSGRDTEKPHDRFRPFIAYPFCGCKLVGAGLVAGLILSGCTPSPQTFQRSQFIMGTTVEITVVAKDEASADTAMTPAFVEIRRIEKVFSTYIQTSELSRINQSAGTRPVSISQEVLQVIQEAIRIAELTEGGFNVMIGPAISLWNVTDQPRIPSDEELEGIRSLIDFRQIQLDEVNRTIYLPETGMKIDVGGIGKGYAADQAEAILKHHGITRGIVAVAGDLKMFGKRADGDPFRIAIRHPRNPEEPMGEVSLQDKAISTSGDYERFFIHNGHRYHHILDPKTLFPATLSQSVTVIADRAIVTDALSTGIFVMGPRKGMALIERLPGIEGLIVDAEGNMSVSSGLQSRWRPLH